MGRRNPPIIAALEPAEMPSPGKLWPVWGLLVGCAWIAFSPALDNGFVDWDDRQVILENDSVQGLGWEQVRFAFTTFNCGLYQPLGWLVQGLTYEIYGLDPRGYHLVCLLFHVVNVVLLHLLCVRFVERMPEVAGRLGGAMGWLCGVPVALYAVHPLRVELVAWASSQAYLPGVTFSLLATLAYLRAHPPGGAFRRRWMIGSSALVVLAVLSKGSAVVLPFVFLILDAYPLGRLGQGRPSRPALGRVMIEKAPILAVCLAFTAVAFAAKRDRVEPEVNAQPVLIGRVAQACFGACFYLEKTAWPFGVTAFYPRPERGDFRTPLFAASVAGVVLAVAAAIWQRRRWPWLPATLAAYLVIASPYLGLARVGITLASDRYSYAPTMAWVVLGCAGLCRLALRRWSRPALLGAGAGLIVVAWGLMALCSAQCRVWGSSVHLWGQALEHAGWSPELHDFLGASLADEGETGGAIAEFREALRLRPHYFEASYHLGVSLDRRGEADAAIASFREAARLRPEDARVHRGLGVALLGQREVDEAIGELTRALELRPRYTEAYALLGGAFALRGRLDEAIVQYREAVRLDPNHSASRVSLGLTLARQGRSAEAMTQLREAIGRDRQNPEAHYILGAILVTLGRRDEAAMEFEEALRLRPDHVQARAFLAKVRGSRM